MGVYFRRNVHRITHAYLLPARYGVLQRFQSPGQRPIRRGCELHHDDCRSMVPVVRQPYHGGNAVKVTPDISPSTRTNRRCHLCFSFRKDSRRLRLVVCLWLQRFGCRACEGRSFHEHRGHH